MHGSEDALRAHLEAEHASDLGPIAAHMVRGNAPDAFLSIYNEGIASRCRDQAPLAGCSIDRKALHTFVDACSKDNVEALVCFSCACIYTRVKELAIKEKSDIEWVQPLQRDPDSGDLHFLGRPVDDMVELLSLGTYLGRYDQLSPRGHRLTQHETFDDWSLRVPSATGHPCKILCCPEDCSCIFYINLENACRFLCSLEHSVRQDRRCRAEPGPLHGNQLCEGCELPLCSACKNELMDGKLPPLALANDMWTGYAPERLIEKKVTVMEAICACPCVTTLICMTMEARYEENLKQEAREAEPLNSTAHMARHRFGARGNALTFPLPLEDLFQALHEQTSAAEGGQPLQLPRVGPELGQVARVLLKTNKQGTTSDAEIKTLIHQALVRREARVKPSCVHVKLKTLPK